MMILNDFIGLINVVCPIVKKLKSECNLHETKKRTPKDVSPLSGSQNF